ncbi:MAG: thioredoxin family protein [Candidatus Nanohaloarchaea archaeon]|nr:thioredoxin family protein [Candidatus Nanohaloarchaea archaeon]
MTVVESREELEVGDTAPSFELPGADGNTYTLDHFREYEAVLIVFTCNHCPYAQAKNDELNRLHEQFDDLAVIGINPNDAEEYPDDSFERMKERVADREVRYFYLRDESQDVAEAYGAQCTPDPFLFRWTDDGDLELVYHGRLDDALNPDEEPSEFYMEQAVEQVLAGKTVEMEFRPAQGCSIKWKD